MYAVLECRRNLRSIEIRIKGDELRISYPMRYWQMSTRAKLAQDVKAILLRAAEACEEEVKRV